MKKTLSYILIAIPVLLFFCITIAYSQNIPYNDDFPTIIGFLNELKKAGSFSNALSLFFSPYGEHRIFFVRLFSSLQLFFSGKLNFAVLAFIGNIAFLVAYVFLARSFKVEKDKKLFYAVPTAYFLFQLQTWSNNIWAMASLSNTMIFCWVILSLYHFFNSGAKAGYVYGMLFALLATYTNGNGVFVLFVAAFTFFCLKQYKKGAGAAIAFLLLFILNTHSSSGSMVGHIQQQGPVKIIGMFFVFLGSNFFHPAFIYIALAGGIAFAVYFIYLFFVKKYYTVNPVLFSMYLFIFLTAIAIATQRELLDINTVAPSRYRIYGTLLIAITYMSVIEIFPKVNFRRFVQFVVLPFAVLFFVAGTYVGKAKMANRYELNRSYAFLLENNIYLDHQLDSLYSIGIANRYISNSNIPVSSLCMPLADDLTINKGTGNTVGLIETVQPVNGYYIIKGWAGKADSQNTLNKAYAIVYSGGKKQVYKANFLEVFSFINDKKMFPYITCGFLIAVPGKEYAAADNVWIAISRDIKSRSAEPVLQIKK